MTDFKLANDGDLYLSPEGDISITQSVCQAVRIRLLWFFGEWRIIPQIGFPYFEDVFIKNPSESKIRHLIREEVMSVDEVTDVTKIDFSLDKHTRAAKIKVEFSANGEIYYEEVEYNWQAKNTD
ncbi:MAG: hypothetical protein OSJ43_06440 [Oscillospiraceae bacterium]|nr:hypothetical protein [Oscillospiraceae bacterium]